VIKTYARIAPIAAFIVILSACTQNPDASPPSPIATTFPAYQTTMNFNAYGAWRSVDGLEAMMSKTGVDTILGSQTSRDFLDAAVAQRHATVIDDKTKFAVDKSMDLRISLSDDRWQACHIRILSDDSQWWVNCADLAVQP